MTSPTPLPDLAGALRAYLRAQPSITALVGDRVWIGWPRDPNGALRVKVPPFVYALVIETGRGGLPPDTEAPYLYERVDVSCLGPDEHDANLLYRTVTPCLVDPTRTRPQGFRAANTLVAGAYLEGGPVRALDPATNWPRTWSSYQIRYCAIPLSELG